MIPNPKAEEAVQKEICVVSIGERIKLEYCLQS
jgi:hypothetical protein